MPRRFPSESAIVACLRKGFPRMEAAYLFGSAAEASMRPDSDVDIAVLLPLDSRQSIGFLDPTRLALEDLTGRDVDLIALREAPTVLQKEIILRGRRIACDKEAVATEFEIRVISAYQKLNRERADILRDFEASGRAVKL